MKRWVLAVSLPLVFVSHVLANDVVSGQKLGGAGTAAFNGSATAVGDVNISGTWDVLVVYANGKPDKLLTFQLRQTGNSVSGNILEPSTGKSGTINGTISGERFDFVIVTTDEPCTFTGSASVSSTGDQMTGAAPSDAATCVDRFGLSGIKRTSTPAPGNIAGTWDILVAENGKPGKTLTFQLSQTGNSVSGNFLEASTGKSGTISGTISGERFDFVIVATNDGCTFTGSASINSTGDQMTGAGPSNGATCVNPFTLSGIKRISTRIQRRVPFRGTPGGS